MKYALIGSNLTHSFSILLHHFLNNDNYILYNLKEKDLENFFEKRDFLGINVTMPYKEKTIKYLDEIDPIAKKIGCVNTIVNQYGKLIGYNTDYYGFKKLLEANNINPYQKKCVILGTGATSKTIKTLLLDLNAKEIVTVSRYKNGTSITYDELNKVKDFNILINATPVGMYPNNYNSCIDIMLFTNLEVVIDVIYNPLKTNLIQQALERKIKAINGLKMFIEQGIYSDKLFFHKSKLNKINEKNFLSFFSNIILIGMPYSGKTSIGKALANLINFDFVDLDTKIEIEEKQSIKEIIENKKENYFRFKENLICQKYSKLHHQVISTGGGIIKEKKNILALRQNGIIIYIERDIEKINFNNSRPLASSKDDYQKLYELRKNLYIENADIIVQNNSSIEKCIEIIKSKLEKYIEV